MSSGYDAMLTYAVALEREHGDLFCGISAEDEDEKRCLRCGEPADRDAKFCTRCGLSLKPHEEPVDEAERRVEEMRRI